MIMMILKFTIFFTLSFLILTIPVKGKKLFYILDKFSAPITSKLSRNLENTSSIGKQLFYNSNPRHSIYNDKVRKKQAAILNDRKKETRDTEEEISISEQGQLNTLIESSSRK